MKLEKIETYNLTGLTQEDLSFLSEIIEKVNLSEDSSPLSIDLLHRWRNLLCTDLICEACDTKEDVQPLLCPLSNSIVTICPSCHESRKKLANEQRDNSTSE